MFRRLEVMIVWWGKEGLSSGLGGSGCVGLGTRVVKCVSGVGRFWWVRRERAELPGVEQLSFVAELQSWFCSVIGGGAVVGSHAPAARLQEACAAVPRSVSCEVA